MKLNLCSLIAMPLLCLLAVTVSAQDVQLPPAADLDFQIEYYFTELDKNVEDLAASKNFAADANVLARDGNALILVALAAGMSKEDGKYKAAAPEIIKAAQKVADAKDIAAAKAAVAEVKTAATKKSSEKLDWSKHAKMEPTMKLAVPRINTSMTRYIRTDATLKRGVPNVAGGIAALAAISQGLTPNFDETTKPEEKDQWIKFSEDFHNAAMKASVAINGYKAGSVTFDDFKTALTEMKENCEHCHEVFASGVKVE